MLEDIKSYLQHGFPATHMQTAEPLRLKGYNIGFI